MRTLTFILAGLLVAGIAAADVEGGAKYGKLDLEPGEGTSVPVLHTGGKTIFQARAEGGDIDCAIISDGKVQVADERDESECALEAEGDSKQSMVFVIVNRGSDTAKTTILVYGDGERNHA